MATNSLIEWTNHTWNPWVGCLKVSPGCKFCYMYAEQGRYGSDPKMIRKTTSVFRAPYTWKEPAKVFTCSWSDFFIEHADAWRADAWEIIKNTPHLTYQILTKRPQNIAARLPGDWGDGYPNVWLGVSVENEDYTWRLDTLATVPASVHFVSYEPALGPVDFSPWLASDALHWLISGGESGLGCRPANSDWFRSVRDQCQRYGVAYFHKQNGGNHFIDGSKGGHHLDGETWRQFPIITPAQLPLVQAGLF
jgi:protein gp37